MTNILILSCGSRNKIVQYFKRNLENKGIVVAADCSRLAPALYDADKYYILPKFTEEGYIDKVLEICRSEQIKGVLSLIDPELAFLAENVERFNYLGTTVIGSCCELCELSMDKFKMYEWLTKHHYHTAKTWIDRNEFYRAVENEEVFYPVFVKPRNGSASISISTAEDKEIVEMLFRHNSNLIIQEYLHGHEIGADVYIDMISKEIVSIFTKKKIKMRAGETDKAVSFKDSKLFDLITQFVLEAGYQGQIDIDIFEIDGEYYISEVNPRFGGGYPHAYEAGVDHMRLIIENLEGRKNKKMIGNYKENCYMMKYSEVKVGC